MATHDELIGEYGSEGDYIELGPFGKFVACFEQGGGAGIKGHKISGTWQRLNGSTSEIVISAQSRHEYYSDLDTDYDTTTAITSVFTVDILREGGKIMSLRYKNSSTVYPIMKK